MALTLQQGVDLVAGGGVVVYPTETLWGIGGAATDRKVYARVLSAKGIAEPRPLPVLAASGELVRDLVKPVPGLTELAEEFWPGGLTLVVPPADRRLDHLLGSGGGLGVRVSGHPVAQSLAAAAGGLLLSTSANRTGQRPPRKQEEVEPAFLATTDGVVEWAGTAEGAPSTLLIFDRGWWVARVGSVAVEDLRRVLAATGEELSEECP
jgi:L-threonylcarbamoyladenylate synthase